MWLLRHARHVSFRSPFLARETKKDYAIIHDSVFKRHENRPVCVVGYQQISCAKMPLSAQRTQFRRDYLNVAVLNFAEKMAGALQIKLVVHDIAYRLLVNGSVLQKIHQLVDTEVLRFRVPVDHAELARYVH